MSNTLQIALIQTHLVWENPIQNRNLLSEKIETLPEAIDIIVLPEMFTTGFTMNAIQLAETMQGDTMKWMQTIAKQRQVAITGSIIITENNLFYNRLVFVHPDGQMDTYDKRHRSEERRVGKNIGLCARRSLTSRVLVYGLII